MRLARYHCPFCDGGTTITRWGLRLHLRGCFKRRLTTIEAAEAADGNARNVEGP